MGRRILEREQELAALAVAADEAKAGDGSVVLIAGEAGIGKSSLVHALRSVLPPETRLLVGYCDDLATPRVGWAAGCRSLAPRARSSRPRSRSATAPGLVTNSG